LKVVEQQPPLQVIRAFPAAEGAVLTHLHNVSGGVLSGDRLSLEFTVGPGAQAQLTSTGATRVYRRREGQPAAVQWISASIAEGGLLEYLPDPLIPFAGSAYRQHVQIDLHPRAGLFWWEVVSPGREAQGECFAYDSLEMTFDLRVAGTPAAFEHFRLEPARKPLSSPARLGPFRHFASFYICKASTDPGSWRTLEGQLAETAREISCPGRTCWGVSTLPAPGLVVRGLSLTGRDLAPGLLTFWSLASQALYGRAASPPRKLS
jgi:urease accessory protein